MRLPAPYLHLLMPLVLIAAFASFADSDDVAVPPAVPQQIVYGHSVLGRPLVATILGSGPNVTLIGGGIHGNETSAPGVVEKLLAYLIANPAELDGYTVVFVPRVNPDGCAAGTRANAHGVDLNRNFPYDWAPRRKGVRLSTGAMALSEPEARGFVELLDRTHPSKVVSVHWPLHTLVWSGADGKSIALAMQRENHYAFTNDVGYPTPGSLGSYLNHARGISCVTLELPRESVDKAWRENRDALLAAIRFPGK
ncbi:MAG: DUF2817 domain-containing protein [Capsulimonadaceae bacterium]|nr:DUF2817 domain-containing protein [Capsulimonadaceae bacterium]